MVEETQTVVEEPEKIDGRTNLGKILARLENAQNEIRETLADHEKRITNCSIRR